MNTIKLKSRSDSLLGISILLGVLSGACASEEMADATLGSGQSAAPENRVGVVIRFADDASGRVIAAGRCVRLEDGEKEISGQELLTRALPKVTQYTAGYAFGVALCGIETSAKGAKRRNGCYPSNRSSGIVSKIDARLVGHAAAQGHSVSASQTASADSPSAPQDECFCDKARAWAYYLNDTGANQWTFSNVGYSTRKIRPGQLDGWVWSAFDTSVAPKVEPPVVSLKELCKYGPTTDALGPLVYLPLTSK